MVARAFILLLSIAFISGQKAVGIRGQLSCGSKPLPGANITLAAEKNYPKKDKVLASVTSDAKGFFEIYKVARGFRNLKAVVKVTHSCDFMGNLRSLISCERKVTYRVPDDYVAKNSTRIQQWYQLDTPNMAYVQVDEMGRC